MRVLTKKINCYHYKISVPPEENIPIEDTTMKIYQLLLDKLKKGKNKVNLQNTEGKLAIKHPTSRVQDNHIASTYLLKSVHYGQDATQA